MRSQRVYRFGNFLLDPVSRLLSSNNQEITIAPKPFELLAVLVERHGQAVSKEQLIELIWANTFVEEANISQNIFLLRKLLGKTSAGNQYIETVSRRGYRFAGKVREGQVASLDVATKQQNRKVAGSPTKQRGAQQRKAICSIAVLPLANANGDLEMEYLSDGITESVINTLAQLPYIRVVARSTVFRYKGREVDVQGVAAELNVEAVLTGRVSVRGDLLNVQVDLINVADQAQFWGKQYNLRLAELTRLQGEIAQDVVDQLKLRLTSEERQRITVSYSDDMQAYELYLRGCYHQNKLTEDGLRKGLEYFQKTVARQPNFALAYAGLADCYALGGLAMDPNYALDVGLVGPNGSGTSGSRQELSKAKAAAMMALEIDDELPEAHAALAFIRYRLDWNWSGAEKGYRRAIELRPNYARAHYLLGLCLRTRGLLDEALAELKLAHEMDPLALIIKVELGRVFYFARYYDQAIQHYQEALELEPSFCSAHYTLGQAYVQKGMYEEAIAQFQQATPLSGDDPESRAALAHVYAVSGRTDDARKVLGELRQLQIQRYVSPYDLAVIYVGLDDKEQALEWLENAYADRSVPLIEIKVEPLLDKLRPEPRFVELIRRVGFAP
jgi:TolB-like protein/Flp pilus assembly protein TadD